MSGIHRPRYERSHALIVGINAYEHCAPLQFGVADAEGIAGALTTEFSFEPQHVHILTDAEATKKKILDRFMALAQAGTDPDDRVVFFFAGHGHTESSSRGEVGFLVPSDGQTANLASLIRWDELTRGADFILAKHILFLMDACYGGLAIKRSVKPGSMRFVKDMLLRQSRQVLTAGKADEPVDDAGGPIPGHSPFTGHLLDALSGKAADSAGMMTANGVMAYVYQAVASDPGVSQTPHYGHVDGDGDLVFRAPGIFKNEEAEDSKTDDDVLMAVPVTQPNSALPGEDVVSRVKEYLAEERFRLRLFELVGEEVRKTIALTGEDRFPHTGPWKSEDFPDRLERYNALMRDLVSVQALLGYWSTSAAQNSLTLGPKRLSDQIRSAGGNVGLLALRWYPCVLLLYAGGVGAVAAEQYSNLRALFLQRAGRASGNSGGIQTYLQAVVGGISDVADSFRLLPGHERHYVAKSEYLFKLLQPQLDDVLFLGSDYEVAFDQLEVLMALEYAHQEGWKDGLIYGPIGRFGWKASGRLNDDPYGHLMAEAEAAGATWAPARAGLFGGSTDRFLELARALRERIGRLGWF